MYQCKGLFKPDFFIRVICEVHYMHDVVDNDITLM